MAPIKNVDISSAAFKANPYPFYAQLRDEAPVHRITLGDKRTAWLVSRYEDVVTVLKDDRFVKDKRSVLSRDQMAKPHLPPDSSHIFPLSCFPDGFNGVL